jgi:hypothetical protein
MPPSETEDPVSLLPAWQRNDAKIMSDTTDFWLKQRALPPNITPQQRLQELSGVAYVANELVGVSTIELRHTPWLRCRLGFFRCLVDPAYIHRRIASRLTKYSRALLESWSKEHPSEKILGMALVLENPNFDRLGNRPVWHADVDYVLIGYTPEGHQVRIAWFEHARLE